MAKSILIFTTETAPSFAGDGRNALLLAKTLIAKGISISICCLNPGGILPPREVINGIDIYRIRYFYNSFFGRLLTRDLISHFLTREARSYSTWMIYGAMPGYQLILFFGWVLHKKIIFRSTLYGFDDIRTLIKEKNLLTRIIRKWLFSHIDVYYALNSAFEKEWCTIFSKNRIKIFTSPQGVDSNRFSPVVSEKKKVLRRKFNLPEKEFILLTVGHLTERKGYPELFYMLYSLHKDFLLIHVGRSNAPSWDALSVRNSEMGFNLVKGKELLGQKISFMNVCENIEEYYHAADIFILSSTAEGFPSNSTNEAMSCGLPVLIRNIPGYDDYIAEGMNGLVFGDKEEFIQKIQELFEDQTLRSRIGTNARATAVNRLDINIIAERFIQFLSAI